MISATDLKNGINFSYEGKLYQVLKYEHQKIARGGGTIKLTIKNLETGEQEMKTFNSSLKVEEIQTAKKKLQFLYKNDTDAVFMDEQTFEQIEVSLKVLKEQVNYLKEGQSVNVLFNNDKPLSVELPPNVILKVIESDPGVRGNSATNIYKTIKLVNGLEMKAPLFIKVNDKVKVDTRTGEYVERIS